MAKTSSPLSNPKDPLQNKTLEYLNAKSGLRLLIFAILFSVIMGLSVRLIFNPQRLKNLIESAIGKQADSIGFRFQSAHLSLARGSLPVLAIELLGVQINPAHDCNIDPSVRVAKLQFPVSLSALWRGRLSFGEISAEDLVVDLDGIKQKCHQRSAAQEAPARKDKVVDSAIQTGSKTLVWWKNEEILNAQKIFEGLEFKQVELVFENKTRKVLFDSFSAEWGSQPGSIRVDSHLVVPPDLTYGERLPQLHLQADVQANHAEVRIRAGVSEGNLVVKAILAPAENGLLDAEIKAEIESVPLSTLEPLLTKSGIVQGAFRPRFLWINCEAMINGRFQSLFTENNLNLQNCEIKGNNAKIRADSATRHPNGNWQPIHITLINADLGQISETFGWQGPIGILSDYGKVDGRLSIQSKELAELEGVIKGAQIRFSSRGVRTSQKINDMTISAELSKNNLKGNVRNIHLEAGEFQGKLEFSLSSHASQGAIRASIDRLRLSDSVQKILLDGRIENLRGYATANVVDGKLTSLLGHLSVFGLEARSFRTKEASIHTELNSDNGDVVFSLRSPLVELRQAAPLFKLYKPVFFTHEFDSEWVALTQPTVRARKDNLGRIYLERAEAGLESGHIRLSTEGTLSAEQEIEGWITVNYPKAKKLRWRLHGTLSQPNLSAESKSITDILAVHPDDKVLGLPLKKQ